MISRIKKESVVHGKSWAKVHGGYFSNPQIAAPLIDKIESIIFQQKPDIIVDLGGGTGFLLSELQSRISEKKLKFYNLDCSDVQLNFVKHEQINSIQGSLDALDRKTIVSDNEQMLFIMRSVLHYFGENNYTPILKHLRKQAESNEYFIHQTACFEKQEDADCLNQIYQLMDTNKWYPTISQLQQLLQQTGWEVHSIEPADFLLLDSTELAIRYHFDETRIERIKENIFKFYGEKDDIFMICDYGFKTYLHYNIFICRAF